MTWGGADIRAAPLLKQVTEHDSPVGSLERLVVVATA